MAAGNIDIRRANPDDAPAIGTIYNHYIEYTVATFHLEPLPEAHWRSWFNQFAAAGPHQIFVAEQESPQGSHIVGFAYCAPYQSEREGYATSGLVSIYCAPDFPGRGIGSRLYDALLPEVTPHLHRLYALIALPNAASVALHGKYGFAPIATQSEIGFKFGRYIDVAVMELKCP